MLVVAKKSLAEEQYQDFEVSGSPTFLFFFQPCPLPSHVSSQLPLAHTALAILMPFLSTDRITAARGPLPLLFSLPGMLLPRVACPMAHSLVSFGSQLKCYLLREVFPDCPPKIARFHPSPPITPFNFLHCTYHNL